MKEKEFQLEVEKRCDANGVHYWHVTKIDPGMKGFPDLCILGSHKMIFRELKKATYNSPKGEQARLIYKLKGAGQDVKVWTPDDLEDGTIDQELSALNQPR